MKTGAIAGSRGLIFEPDAVSARLLRAIFAAEWCTVRIVETTRDAIARASVVRPDVVIIRLEQESAAGWRLVAELRAHASGEGAVIIGITGDPDRFPEHAALAHGCDGYFALPLGTRTVAGVVADKLGKRARTA